MSLSILPTPPITDGNASRMLFGAYQKEDLSSPPNCTQLAERVMDIHQKVPARIKAAKLLGKENAGDPKAINALTAVLDPTVFDFFEVKEAAALALGKMGASAQQQTPLLLNLFERSDITSMVRKACLKALRQITPQPDTLVPPLLRLMSLPNESPFFETLRQTLGQLRRKVPPHVKSQIDDALTQNTQLREVGTETPVDACARNRMGFSRTLRSGKYPEALKNFKDALRYIGQHAGQRPKPTLEDFKVINAHLIKGLYPYWAPQTHSWPVQWGGLIRGTDPEVVLEFSDKHPRSGEVPAQLSDFFGWFDQNYDTMEPFQLAAATYQKLIRIHPLYEACGRTTRLFTDWALLGKGYYLPSHPEDYIRGMMMSEKAFANLLRKHGVKITEADPADPVLRTLQGKF